MSWADDQRLLQFSERWLELGLLTEDKLSVLGQEYKTSDDKNTEHYRYRIFRDYLVSHRPLSRLIAEALYDLGEADPDFSMGGAMMHDIVNLEECPATVLDRALTSGRAHLIKLVGRKKLRSQLRAELTPELFDHCLAIRDSIIQRELLEMTLSRQQLERLAEGGAGRAIRNTAAVRLRSRHCPP
jgi:hypothetical protein